MTFPGHDRRQRRRQGCSLVAWAVAGILLAAGLGRGQVLEEVPLRTLQVYVAIGQRSDSERVTYLKEHAGRAVAGAGFLEAILPRSYYDSAVPDNNPAVALIQVSPGRKLVCGLPRVLTPEQLKRFGEGKPVVFQGALVDAHDWGQWTSLYLGSCSLHPR